MYRPEQSERRGEIPSLQALELQTLELLIASGESLEDLLEEWASQLTERELMEQTDARIQN